MPEEYFWGIDPRVLAALPKYGAGAIVGNTNIPAGNVRGITVTATEPAANYNAYVTVDSENITRKVFQAFRELEDYQNLGR